MSVGVDVAVSSVGSRVFPLGFVWSGVLRGLSSGSMAAHAGDGGALVHARVSGVGLPR